MIGFIRVFDRRLYRT